MGEKNSEDLGEKPPGPDLGPNLVLVGYRGTGKTSVGELLALLLGRDFVDLDQVLAEEAGQTISQIVAQSGWDEFRRREKELVARYGPAQGLVLATGGGVVLDWDNVQTLRNNGLVVWLTAKPDTIQTRLAAADQAQWESRPSLTGSDTITEVTQVLQSRQHLYLAAAQIIIDTTHLSIIQVVQEILASIKAMVGEQLGG